MITKLDAIRSLYDGPITSQADGTIVYHGSGDEPTLEQIQAKFAKLQADYDSKQYQRDRSEQYPSIQDQLDMQYHDLVDGTTTWKDSIAKVKANNPKP